MKSFEELLEVSVARHGHLCAGQVIGVRMAMLGCRLLGVEDPLAPENRKKMMVFVEIDRCATDAIESVTGCRMGKRTLKFKDFGINAATFVHLQTRSAYRIVSKESARDQARRFAPDGTDGKSLQVEGYKSMPDGLLFDVYQVRVDLQPWEMPGPTTSRVPCQGCGQLVRDARHVVRDGRVLCRHCAGEGYCQEAQAVQQF